MAVDFAHPVITDLYSAAPGSPDWPTYIQDNIAAVASWLDGADPAGKRTGFKRISGGEIQEWDGSAWVRRALNYFSNTGGAITGGVSITANPFPLELRSGNVAASMAVSMGRTSAEAYLGVSGVASGLTNGDAPGDLTLRNNTGRIFLSLGTSGYFSISSANGIIAGAGIAGIGAIVNNPSLTGVRLGTSPGGLPAVQWTNSGGAVNSKLWDFYASPTELIGRVIDDTFTTDNPWIRVTRSGMTIPNITFPAGRVGIGVLAPAGIALDVGTGYIRVLNDQGYRFLNAAQTRGGNLLADDTGTRITSDAWSVRIATAGVDRFIVTNTALVGINRTPVAGTLEVAGSTYGFSSEGFRIVHDNGYISWYNAAHTARTAYLQALSAGVGVWNIESGTGSFNLNIAGSTYFTLTTGGAYNGAASEPLRLTRTNEFSITSAAASIPNIRYRHGRIAAVIGGAGTITFASAFSSIYACVASLEGGGGSGWILRISNVTTSGFSYAFDNWNSAGSGVACFINYRAVGV